MKAILISTYELGRQPFGLASSAAWLRRAGASVVSQDLAVEPLAESEVATADLVAFYVPMHTATRLATPVARHVRRLNPRAHICFFGLYASVNQAFLRELGADTILGGEFEEGLFALAQRLSQGGAAANDHGQREPVVSTARQHFLTPDRTGLPPLTSYAYLTRPNGERKTVGYTEATRGCKHLCRHCPIVPVYGGRFRVVQRDVVLEDIGNQVAAGAQHVTFGDPDFFNGPQHSLDIVTRLHDQFPELTYDVTIKIEHLLKHAEHLPALHDTGCVLITSAVESFDDRILTHFDKRHTKEEAARAFQLVRQSGVALNPTFVAFTPWTSLKGYLDFLTSLLEFDLVPSVSSIQYGIRLLIPQGSKLLDLPDVRELVAGGYDEEALSYRWCHPDPRVDALCQDVNQMVTACQARGASRHQVFAEAMDLALQACYGQRSVPSERPPGQDDERWPVPYLSEPWYC